MFSNLQPSSSESVSAGRPAFVQGRAFPWLLAVAVALLSFAITAGIWHDARETARKDLQLQFDFATQDVVQRIERRMGTYVEVLRGAQGFIHASPRANQDDFGLYVKALRLQESYPGIQSIGISRIFSRAELERHVAAMRAAGLRDYRVRPESGGDMLTSVTQVVSSSARFSPALGYDMYTDPVRRAAMERARDTGNAAVTARVTLRRDAGGDVPGFLMYLPLYERGLPTATLAARQKAIRGWVYASFRMATLMDNIVDEDEDGIELRIYDGNAIMPENLLYVSDEKAQPSSHAPLFESTRRIAIGGNTWTVAARSLPTFESTQSSEKSDFIAISGIGTGLLLASLVWMLATSRKRAMQLAREMTDELRSSEFRWKHALEGAGDGVWDWDVRAGVVNYSRRWKEMLGYGEDEISDRLSEWEKLVHPDDLAAAREAMTDYFKSRRDMYAAEHRMLCKNGEWKWILSRGIIVTREEQGRPVRMIGTHTDISQLKENEAALRESYAWIGAERQRMKIILENSHDAFIAIDANDRITDWNKQAERTFGWSRDEALGQSLPELIFPPEEAAANAASFRRFPKGGKGSTLRQRIEVTARHRRGNLIPVEIALAAIEEANGYSINAFVRDISERKEAQRREAERLRSLEEARTALQHAQKLEAVGKLTGGVAHDFNNVLQIITGNLQLLQMRAGGDTDLAMRLDNALNAVERGAKLSSQLLAFARRQPLRPKVLNLGRVVQDMGDMLRQSLGESITIETHIDHDLWNTHVDQHQLENVMLNLAINARDAMNGKGRLAIVVANMTLDARAAARLADMQAGEYVSIAVSDNGAGMTPEVRQQAFEPFFTTKPEGQGTGLGLSMAYGFIKQSGGHIDIDSEPGRGTTIRMLLPRSTEKEGRSDGAPAEASGGGSETILVVEDDPQVQASVVAMLKGLGYRVLQADDADAALPILRAHGAEIDLLFTDVVMPGSLNGPELAEQAKTIAPAAAVLFTSGFTQDALGRNELLDPDINLLNKPYRREDLARRVREVLAKAAGSKERKQESPA